MAAAANAIYLFGCPCPPHSPLRFRSFSYDKQLMRKTAENARRLFTINEYRLSRQMYYIICCCLCNKISKATLCIFTHEYGLDSVLCSTTCDGRNGNYNKLYVAAELSFRTLCYSTKCYNISSTTVING